MQEMYIDGGNGEQVGTVRKSEKTIRRVTLQNETRNHKTTVQTIASCDKLFPNDIKCCFSGIPCPIIVAWAIGKLYYENEQ